MPTRLAPATAYLLALLIGCAFVAWLFPAGRLFPAHPLDVAFVGDEAQHVIGQRYFLRDAWRWPLLMVPRLNEPDGVNIAYTDSIPLAALALKLVRGWLPTGFTVTESWIAIAYALQPLAAVFALRSAGEQRLVPALAVAAISLNMPTLLARFGGHEALCSHFLILTAIGLYYRQTAAVPRSLLIRSRLRWAAAPVLLVASLLVHPYIGCLVALVLAATPLTLLLRGDRAWIGAAIRLALCYAVLGGTAVALGYTGGEPAQGFGLYSMNLLSPIVPGPSFLLPTPRMDATGGQMLEGYQYLGAGLLLLAALAGILRPFRGGTPRRESHWGLVILCLLTAMFSLSNRVYLGHRLLLSFGHVPAAVAQFQASGRFFWPVAYVILIASVTSLGRLRLTLSSAVLLGAAALQVVDATTLRNADHQRELSLQPWIIPRDALWPAFSAARRLNLLPMQSCGGESDAPFLQVLLLASVVDLPTNTMYMSRYRSDLACDTAAALAEPLQPGELRVIAPPVSASARWLVPDTNRVCRQAGLLIVCSMRSESLAGLPQPVPTIPPWGVALPPSNPAMHAAFATGWSAPQPEGIWSNMREAHLVIELPDASPTQLTLHSYALAPSPGGTQHVEVAVQGRTLAQWDMPDLQRADWRVDLPPYLAGHVDVTLRISAPTRPSDRGMRPDGRRLGIFVEWLRID